MGTPPRVITPPSGRSIPIAGLVADRVADLAADIASLGLMHCIADSKDGSLLRPAARTTEAGISLAQVFSSDEGLYRYTEDHLDELGELAITAFSEDWAGGLFLCLQGGYGGIILDEGKEGELILMREDLSALYALLTIEAFTALPELWVLAHGEGVHYDEVTPGEVAAFAYESEAAAELWRRKNNERSEGLHIHRSPTSAFLEGIASTRRATRLIVNGGLGDERYYSPQQVHEMCAILRRGERDAAREAFVEHAADRTEGRRLVRSQLRTALCGPGREPLATRERLLQMMDSEGANSTDSGNEQASEHLPRPWQRIERLAYDMEFYAPVAPPIPGSELRPHLFEHEDATGTPIRVAYLYTRRDQMRAALGDQAGGKLRYLRASGLELARWLWSADDRVERIIIDADMEEGTLAFPRSWLAAMLFPTILPAEDLQAATPVRATALASLDYAHGLRPAVQRAMALEHTRLWGPLATARAQPIEYLGGRYIPIFSCREKYERFADTHAIAQAGTRPFGSESPYLDWIQLAAPFDGILLDPGDEAPLTFDFTELACLHLRCQRPAHQPTGEDLVRLATKLSINQRHALHAVRAQLLADWPEYVLGQLDLPDGKGLLLVPGTEAAAAFTSEERLHAYVARLRRESRIDREVRALRVEATPQVNVFSIAARRSGGLVIDPGLGQAGGLQVGDLLLQLTAERLRLRTSPRVPNS